MLKRQPKTSKPARTLRVFLCHASEDKSAVRDLYKRLKSEGLDPWLDEEDLDGGQVWELEIPRAVRATDVVIVCLSQESITKTGYVQKEIKEVLDVADLQPEGTIFVIPARLKPCEVPIRLRKWQYIDLFAEPGYERLLRALRKRAESIGTTVTASSMAASATPLINQKSSQHVTPPQSVRQPRNIPRQTRSQQKSGWRNGINRHLIVRFTLVALLTMIFAFLIFSTDSQNFSSFFSSKTSTSATVQATSNSSILLTADPTSGTLSTSIPITPLSTQFTLPAVVTAKPFASSTTTIATATLPNAVVASEKLNLRTGPGTNYPITSTYSKGEALKVTGKTQNNEWVKVIASNSREGWMFVENLQVNIDLSSLSILPIPPTPTSIPATATSKPKPTSQPQQNPPTAAPAANLDGSWVGTTSVGGTIDFIVTNGRVTNIHFTYPTSVEPNKEGDCSAAGSWAGYESRLNQLRISIGAGGSFAGKNIQIRDLPRLLAEFSGSLASGSSGSGRLREEITVSETCKIVSSFDWSTTKQ